MIIFRSSEVRRDIYGWAMGRSRIYERTLSLRLLGNGHDLESSQTLGFCMDFLKVHKHEIILIFF